MLYVLLQKSQNSESINVTYFGRQGHICTKHIHTLHAEKQNSHKGLNIIIKEQTKHKL